MAQQIVERAHMRLQSQGRWGAHWWCWEVERGNGGKNPAGKWRYRHRWRQKGQPWQSRARMGKRKKAIAAQGSGIVGMRRERSASFALCHPFFSKAEVTGNG